MAKHLVWDWNGTLLDDFSLIVAATNHVITGAGGGAIGADEHRERFRRPIIEFYGELLGRSLHPEEFAHIDRVFHDHYQAALPGCRLSPGARTAVDGWRGTQSLLSMWFHRELVPLVDAYGLTDSFGRVDGLRVRDELDSKHPHLVSHLESLAIDPADCVLIGDSVDDALAAERAGARCVLYAGGFTSRRTLATVGVPVADTLDEATRLAARV